jgi:putative methionine-R-sulfoxide reductase with GAF domain
MLSCTATAAPLTVTGRREPVTRFAFCLWCGLEGGECDEVVAGAERGQVALCRVQVGQSVGEPAGGGGQVAAVEGEHALGGYRGQQPGMGVGVRTGLEGFQVGWSATP